MRAIPLISTFNEWPDLGRVAAGVALLTILTIPSFARGQAAWEFAPYRVNILVAFDESPRLSATWQNHLASSLENRAEAVCGPIWDTSAAVADRFRRDEMIGRIDLLTADDAVKLGPDLTAGDKLYFASVNDRGGTFSIAVREFDCRARMLSPAVVRKTAQRESIRYCLWDALLESFTPAARIESADGPRIAARLRAGGLEENSALLNKAKAGASLRLVVRRNDRQGEPIPGGIQLLPWTLVEITERKDSLLVGKLVSGYRNILPARAGRRTERLGLLVSPRYAATRLVIQSRAKVAEPLAGYEVFAKGEAEEDSRRLGATDWDGALELPRTNGDMLVLLVRSGSQLVARLPLVPGQDPVLIASVTDDDRRLQAEGFVQSFQSRVMDLVARREILASRFRQRLKEGKLDEARAVLDEYRALETRSDLNRALDGQLQDVVSPDRTTQQRIDRLFAAARQLLVKFLDPEQANVLTREFAAAQANPAAADRHDGTKTR